MRKLPLFIMILCIAVKGYAQDSVLHFSENGEFKIVQFTDIHYKWDKKGSEKAIECMNEVLDAEKPDLVVFTGDQVYSSSVASSLPAILQPTVERAIPFIAIFGNHDDEFDCSKPEMYDLLRTLPGCMMPERGESESPDYTISIWANDSSKVASALYFMDSHARALIPRAGKYAWLTFEQINWYRQTSNALISANNGLPHPSLLFLHIPLPEYGLAEADTENTLIGSMGEKVCCPDLNSGIFTAMKEQGDVMAVFCGHDHDNDFAVSYKEVLLAYGRYTGGNTVYNHIGLNGGRVIVLKEGERKLDTWIRLRGGEVINKATFPDNFYKQKNKK